MEEYKLFLKRVGLVGITNLSVTLSSVILLSILTKTLPIEDYGVWVQLTVTVSLIPMLVTLGLPYAMVRFLSNVKKKETIQEGFYSIGFVVVCMGLVTSLLFFLFSNIISISLFNGNILVVEVLSVIILLECINGFLLSYFRTFQQIKKYSIFFSAKTWLQLVLITILVLSNMGILGVVLGLLISSVFILIIMSYTIILEIGLKFPKFTYIKKYLDFGFPTIPGNLSNWLVDSSDRYLIGLFLSSAFVGYYSPGYVLGNSIYMFMAPLAFLLPAVLPKHYENNNIQEVETILKYSLKYFLLLAIPSAFGLSLLSKPLLTILSTSDISSQGYFITPFAAISAVLFGSYIIISNIIILEKKTRILGTIWIIAAITNIGLNIILIPIMGIIGAGITTLISYSLVLILIIKYSFKYLKIDFEFTFVFKSILASSAMSLIILVLKIDNNLFSILIGIGLSIIVYIIFLILLKVIKKEEILFLKKLLVTQ